MKGKPLAMLKNLKYLETLKNNEIITIDKNGETIQLVNIDAHDKC